MRTHTEFQYTQSSAYKDPEARKGFNYLGNPKEVRKTETKSIDIQQEMMLGR